MIAQIHVHAILGHDAFKTQYLENNTNQHQYGAVSGQKESKSNNSSVHTTASNPAGQPGNISCADANNVL